MGTGIHNLLFHKSGNILVDFFAMIHRVSKGLFQSQRLLAVGAFGHSSSFGAAGSFAGIMPNLVRIATFFEADKFQVPTEIRFEQEETRRFATRPEFSADFPPPWFPLAFPNGNYRGWRC